MKYCATPHPAVENWVKFIEGDTQQNRKEFMANLQQNDIRNSMPKNWTAGGKRKQRDQRQDAEVGDHIIKSIKMS
jgi:hypothetical protein